MIENRLVIRNVARYLVFGEEERLTFEPGVNVIVGLPNTGKSKWLRMMDYVFGADGRPEDIFGEDLAQKYHALRMDLLVSGENWTIERKWNETGLRTKSVVNGELMDIKAASDLLMKHLEIPIVHYPQGSPYGPRTWPELGWRTLFRHVYRRQTFWNDLADNQPFSEQHACLMQFVGIAENLFSDEFSDLVSKEKRIIELQTKKEQFISMLQEVSKELIDEKELGVALTPDSIDKAMNRIAKDLTDLQEKRGQVLLSLIQSKEGTEETGDESSGRVVERLGERLAELQLERDRIVTALGRHEEKRTNILEYRRVVADELSRMRRAVDAGEVLVDLKVTNCPACDRIITRTDDDGSNCYLCRRPLRDIIEPLVGSDQRLKFELEQLEGEIGESDELLDVLSRNTNALRGELERISAEVQQIQRTLLPLRSAVSFAIPPEVEVIDMEMGRIDERLKQLDRIKRTLTRRETISDEILKIQQAVASLSLQVDAQAFRIDFEEPSSTLADGMNDYFNSIDAIRPNSWTQGPVSVRLNEKSFRFAVGNSDFKAKLGGTLTLYFLLAYHHALLKLTSKPWANYPGLAILDFPAELEDAATVADKENFVLEPFVQLTTAPGMESLQLIAAGSAFEDLKGAHRIELTRVW